MRSNINRVSRLFQPITVIPKDAAISKSENTSKSYRLMLDMGIIRQANTGMYTLMPLGMRVVDKLIKIVDNEMRKIGAQKLLLPYLTSASLWEKSKRLENVNAELFTLCDRHKNRFLLSPTHEEAITDLVAGMGNVSTKKLPLMLYQISNKWRDEMKPRLGLLRGREFIMKDLYTFDSDMEEARNTYSRVQQAYTDILNYIGIKCTIAEGDTGIMGGLLSHEYHCLSNIGEDTLLICDSCGFYINSNVYEDRHCRKCHGSELTRRKAIEIGHTFLLGTRYSEPLNAMFLDDGKPKPLTMGCFGLGITRLIAAAVETLSKDEELRWPKHLAPYTVCIIPPKENSRYSGATRYAQEIYDILVRSKVDAIIDDRIDMTIGRRIIDARRTGYSYLIVIGKSAANTESSSSAAAAAAADPPLFELHDQNNSKQMNFTFEQLTSFFRDNNNDGDDDGDHGQTRAAIQHSLVI